MGGIITVDIKLLKDDKLKQILALAGFKVVINQRYVQLVDNNSSNADNYSDLTFKSLSDAVKAVGCYLNNQFKFVA